MSIGKIFPAPVGISYRLHHVKAHRSLRYRAEDRLRIKRYGGVQTKTPPSWGEKGGAGEQLFALFIFRG